MQLLNTIRQIPSICKDKAFYISPFKPYSAVCVHIFVDIWSSDDVMEGDLEEEPEVKLLVPE